jgi:metal-responsive CopG/Arc/MetJ family transcriptional regulator
MKTAISLPDELFEAADELAQKLGVSRSQLYTRALSEYVAQHTESDVTERLNAVYSEVEARLDPVLSDLQFYSVGPGDEW